MFATNTSSSYAYVDDLIHRALVSTVLTACIQSYEIMMAEYFEYHACFPRLDAFKPGEDSQGIHDENSPWHAMISKLKF